MQQRQSGGVPRTPDEPTAAAIRDAMAVCEPYIVSDLESEFPDASRWTIQRRLDALVQAGEVKKKKHNPTRVSYWIPKPE